MPFRQKQVSFATYLGMLAVVFAIDSGMEAVVLSHVYPPIDQQFLNGVAPKAMALLTDNGSEPVRVASFNNLVTFVRLKYCLGITDQ